MPYSTAVKYLGVVLTPKLQWAPQIKMAILKGEKRLAFLRSMAGVRWGGHPSLLLTTYKTTIRTILEYGAGIVDPSTKKKNWTALQRLCSAGVRVSMGAMPSSPIPSLLVEAAEWPIARRMEYLTDRLLIRWRSQLGHPALHNCEQLIHDGQPTRKLRARPPLLLRRLLELPPPPPPRDSRTRTGYGTSRYCRSPRPGR